MQVMSQTLVAGAVLVCGWCYFTMLLPEGETQLKRLGLICSVVTVSMYLSPLADLVRASPPSSPQACTCSCPPSSLVPAFLFVSVPPSAPRLPSVS